jgi:hypothetical protein
MNIKIVTGGQMPTVFHESWPVGLKLELAVTKTKYILSDGNITLEGKLFGNINFGIMIWTSLQCRGW